jgi:hypothetical protein
MAQDTTGQFWSKVGARAQLEREQFTEYHAFTGTDIKAFILPQGDQAARIAIEQRLEELAAESFTPSGDPDKVNQARQTGDHEVYVPVSAKSDPASRGLAHDILPLVNLQSITISTFRAKSQVRALGHVNAVGLARGSRTVAGTFILTEFNRDAFWDILTAPLRDINVGDQGPIQPDQMRPFDIILLFAHEMGNLAIRHIYGLEIVTNGVVYSVQDYYSENTVSYIAQDVSPLIPLTPAFDGSNSRNVKLTNLVANARAETLNQDFEYLKKTRNPFR